MSGNSDMAKSVDNERRGMDSASCEGVELCK